MSTFPHLHRAPARGWINDPNGLALVDGRFHLFYQFNPAAPVHDAIAWGHVSSTDLLRWTEHPVALTPQPHGPDRDGCWSGCLVVDDGVPSAVYTAIRGGPEHGVVALATGDRALLEWTQHPEAIVETPRSPIIRETRDPFLFTRNGRRYAVQGCGDPAPGSTPSLMLWGCDDLRDWTELGPLLTGDDPDAARIAEADIWECPGLVRVDERWVLVMSLWRSVDGAFALSGVRWLLGDLEDGVDGGLRFVVATGGVLDDGPAFYAPQLLALPDRVLTSGWSWSSAGPRSRSTPTAGRAPSRRRVSWWSAPTGLDPSGARMTGMASAAADRTEAITEAASKWCATDRSRWLEGRCAAPDRGRGRLLRRRASRILVDGSLVEAFGPTGSFTTRAYPEPGSTWVVDGAAAGWVLGLPDAVPPGARRR